MKIRQFCLIGFLSIILNHSLFSQTINVIVTSKGNVSIKLNDTEIKEGSITSLPLSESSAVIFNFTSIQDSTVTFVIASMDESAGKITFVREDFLSKAFVTTDNNLQLKNENEIINIKKTFQIGLRSTKSGETKKYTFIPQFGQQAGKPNESTITNEKNEKDVDEDKRYQPGSAVYDALKLADNQNLTQEELKMIVKYYYPSADVNDVTKAKALIDTTPFLKDVKIRPLKGDRISAQAGGNILSSLSASAIGGLDVTAFADGLAKFLVKRTKQELSVAFFEKLKRIIDSTEDLKTLFPNIADHLSNIGDEIYDYERYIQNLREAFKKDITAVHYTFPGIIENHATFFEEHRSLKIGLNTGCYIARELEKRTHPGDILATYPFEYFDAIKDVKAIGILKTIQLFSASMRDTTTSESGNYWVSIGKLRELVNNRRALGAYFGLVYRETINRYDRVPYGNKDLASLLIEVSEKYNEGLLMYDTYRRFVLRLGDKVDALNKMIKEYEKAEADSSGLEKYAKYFKASVDLIEFCTEAGKLPIIKDAIPVPDIKSAVQKYFDISYEVADLVVDAYKKNYSASINHVVRIFNIVEMKADPVVNKILKYGSFLATLATAQNSDEVAKAIETAALPVGSSRVKRQSPFNVSLNAYTGLFIGKESIRGLENKNSLNSYGVAAPVGIAISRGHSILFFGTSKSGWKEAKKDWSTSLFISLIDIGAVTAYRFKNDEAAEVPTIQLKNIVSPGAYISIGIPKTPLSFNFGAQMGPNLRKIITTVPTVPGEEESNKRYLRVSASFCVDIPLFNLYTKSRTKLD